jgi:hypothetical protein
MRPTLKFSAFATLFVVAAILVSRPTAGGDNQWPLCAKGCVLSNKGYAARSGSSIAADNTRQGVNQYETLLRASNLVCTGCTFGYQNSVQVDGQIYAQPLYMSGLANSFVRSEGAVFVATEHGSVYAFDAYTPTDLLLTSSLCRWL